MNEVSKFINLYIESLSAARAGKRGKPPVITNGSVNRWDEGSLRGAVELGREVASAMEAEWEDYDPILARGYHAHPTSFLALISV